MIESLLALVVMYVWIALFLAAVAAIAVLCLVPLLIMCFVGPLVAIFTDE